jgi:GAF domain-containing protein/HAMP domain-containing protein
MKNLTRQQTIPPASGIATDHLFRMGLIRVLSDIGVLAFFAYLSFQIGAWQLTYLTIGIGAMVVVGFVGLWFIRRQRPQLGIWLIVAELWPAALLVIALIDDVALPLGVIILILTLFTAGQVLPQKQTGWALVIATVFFLVELGLDAWNPAYRLAVPAQFLIGIFTVAGALILIYGYFTIRSFPNYSLRTKLAIAFLLVTLVSLGALALLNARSTRQRLLESTDERLQTAAAQTATRVDTFLETNLDTLAVEAQLPSLVNYLGLPPDQQGQQTLAAREALATLITLEHKDPIHISSYALLDNQGRNLLDSFIIDMGNDESGEDYFKAAIETQQPYISPVSFSKTTNRPFIYFSNPVRNRVGEVIGVLRLRYNAIVLQNFIAQASGEKGLVGRDSFAILLDEHQIRLADGEDTADLFKSIVPLNPKTLDELKASRRLPNLPTEELSTNLPAFAQGLANGTTQRAFSAEVHPEVVTQDHLEQVGIAPLSAQPWVVAFAQTPEIYEAPIQEQIQSNLLFTIMIGMAVAVGAFVLGQYLAGPITRLTATAQQISGGNLQAQATAETDDEIGQLAEAFNSMTAQLRHLIGSLEDQVQARTMELSLSMEVGQRAAAIRELAELLPTITEFIRQQFDLYYTQVYFIDNLGQNLVLQAGTGRVGQELLARHHSLPVGRGSIVGQVAAEGEAIVVSETTKSDIHKLNPLLPDTRSELAIPLIVEGRVIGVLDMQATQPHTFTEKNRTVFEAMGTQFAIAIYSAQQWALAQEAQEKSEQAVRQLTRQTWTETLTTQRRNLGFAYDLSAVKPITSLEQNGGVVEPVVIQNQVIGQLTVQPPEGKVLSADELALLSAVSQQLAQKAENVRLFEETQQRATREQIARQIADKIRASRDIEMALKTAAAELNKALGTAKAVVNLQIVDPAQSTKTDE